MFICTKKKNAYNFKTITFLLTGAYHLKVIIMKE